MDAFHEGDIGQAKQKYVEALELFRAISDKTWAEDTERKLQELASQPSS